MMGPLTSPSDLERVRDVAQNTFQSFDAVAPFRPSLRARVLIYPIDYTMLDAQQLRAVSTAAGHFDEHRAYVVPYGRRGSGWEETFDHRVIDFRNPADYRSEEGFVLEHLLFSPSARWGVATSDAEYALAAGDPRFIELLMGELPRDDVTMAQEFVRDWREQAVHGARSDWVAPMLRHVYGDRAAQLWPESDSP